MRGDRDSNPGPSGHRPLAPGPPFLPSIAYCRVFCCCVMLPVNDIMIIYPTCYVLSWICGSVWSELLRCSLSFYLCPTRMPQTTMHTHLYLCWIKFNVDVSWSFFYRKQKNFLVAILLNLSRIKLCSISHWFQHPSHFYVSLQMFPTISALCYIEGGKNLNLIRHLYDQITTCWLTMMQHWCNS